MFLQLRSFVSILMYTRLKWWDRGVDFGLVWLCADLKGSELVAGGMVQGIGAELARRESMSAIDKRDMLYCLVGMGSWAMVEPSFCTSWVYLCYEERGSSIRREYRSIRRERLSIISEGQQKQELYRQLLIKIISYRAT